MAKATRNLITEVLNPEDNNRNTVHVVANAIYFKGEWRDPFDKEDTVDREFHRLDGSSVEVLKLPYEMMNESNWDWMLYHSLPKFCMCVFLPDDRKGLQGMVEEIASSPKFFHDHLPLKCVPVGQFRLPKFKLSFETRIVAEDLKHLGLHLPFDEAEANMTDMLLEEDERRLFVSHVIHKEVVDMNEAGSEAAAVTVECDDMGCSLYDDSPPPPKQVDFVAEHPFAFFIVEETSGAVVFSGHVLDPSKEE
ncbi:putative serpin-Z5 [Miscanthus floridulus]|uniref:putative serpin-Z5 n=1 Tax=Miscanthus floridulus TaxID=154761 RepID=UPI003457C565